MCINKHYGILCASKAFAFSSNSSKPKVPLRATCRLPHTCTKERWIERERERERESGGGGGWRERKKKRRAGADPENIETGGASSINYQTGPGAQMFFCRTCKGEQGAHP